MTKDKPCKICQAKRYANTSYCYKHHRENERIKKEEKAKKKKERKEGTKKFQKEIEKKLMKTNDRLYQEIGRAIHNKCFFGHNAYSCLHHFIRKSQSLYTRYDLENGINICVECHCSIHMGQNSILEGQIIIEKGEEWFERMKTKKQVIVYNKLEFLKEKNVMLKSTLEKLTVQNS